MTISIARPKTEEAERFAALHVQCWREAYRGLVPDMLLDQADMGRRAEIWQAALADPQRIVFGAHDDDEPVGLIMAGRPTEILFQGMDGHISALYVAASHYRQGLGRRLLAAAASDWVKRGGTSLSLGVIAANRRARNFYEALGARLVSEGSYMWDGHDVPDAIYVFDDLGGLASIP